MFMRSINPATGETLQSFPTWQADEVNTALSQVACAQTDWAALGFAQRAQLMRKYFASAARIMLT